MALHLSVLVLVTIAAVLRSPETSMVSHNRSLFCVHVKSSGGGTDKVCHLQCVNSKVMLSVRERTEEHMALFMGQA